MLPNHAPVILGFPYVLNILWVGFPIIINNIFSTIPIIDVKADNGKPSELQLVKINDIRKAGGFAYVAYPSGWNRLKDIIDGLLIDKFNREEDVILK